MVQGESALQGTLSTSGTVFFTVEDYYIGKVTSMRFDNPTTAYTLTVKKYSVDAGALIQIYTLLLNAGDIVLDDFSYYCKPGEYIQVTSSVPGTYYYVIAYYSQTTVIPTRS